jgi:hypothetical protein
MNRIGLLLWIGGMVILGLMSAYLFSQAILNREELDNQASRNILMIRDALLKSTEDLRAEIRSFSWYTFASHGDNKTQKQAAALQQNDRDNDKFKFSIAQNSTPEVFFTDSVVISKIPLQSLWLEGKDASWFNAMLNDTKEVHFKKIFNIPNQKDSDMTFLSTKVSYQNWLREMGEKNIFFDELVFIRENGEVLYPKKLEGLSFAEDINKDLTDSIRGYSGKFQLQLFSNQYSAYIVPLVQGNTKIWVLGLIQQGNLEKAAYKIDFTILVISVLALIILLALLPIISFLSMGKGDVLSQKKVITIGASLLMFMLVAGWTCSYFIHFGHELEKDEILAGAAKHHLSEKICYMLQQLEKEKIDSSNVNEIFQADSKGQLVKYQTLNYHTIKDSLDFSFYSVSHRNYYQYHQNDKKEDPLFMERIFSQTDGVPEQIISKQGKENVQAISFKMQYPPLEDERRFLLVKKSGEVVYASSKFQIQFTQLQSVVEAEKWETFETIFNYDESYLEDNWIQPIRINGHEYKALISPMNLGSNHEPLWYIYLVDLNNYHIQSGLAAMESFLFTSLYLVVILLMFSLTNFLIKQKYNWKKFLFWWILYREHKAVNFKYASIALFIFISLWFIGSLVIDSLHGSLILIFSCGIFSILLVYGILYFGEKNSEYQNKKPYYFFFLIWFIGLGFLPGLSISDAVFEMEEKIWDESLINNVKQSVELDSLNKNCKNCDFNWYQEKRSSLFSTTILTHDKHVSRFINPHPAIYHKAASSIGFDLGDETEHSFNWVTIVVLVLLLLFLLLFWHTLNFLLKKLFWLDFNVREENALGSIIQSELNHCTNLRLFLTGCDSNVSRYWIYSQFRLKEDELLIIDCSDTGLEIPNPIKFIGKKALLIEDVHTLDSVDEFMKSIPDIHELSSSIHLILSSGISWRNLVSRLSSEEAKVRFSELMNGYYFEFVPLKPQTNSIAIHTQNTFNEEELELYFYKRGLISKNSEDPNARLLLQRYGKAYFYNIWAELSLEEKNVCYSYAKEGFLNYQHYDEVVELFQKGVISKSELAGNLQLFSKTFRFFVLATISTRMKKEIKEYRKKNSNAGNVQWAVFSFLIVAIGLVAYFERSFFTELQALVTGILGLVTFVAGEVRRFFVQKS